jgi:hypothetical protein
MENKFIVLFPSVHEVFKAEKALKERGIRCDLVPVPKKISTSCGMAVELDEDGAREIPELARRYGFEWHGIYRMQGPEFVRIQAAG